MKKPARPPVRVSDHALVRYLERVGGWPIEELKADIAARIDGGAQMGASAVVVDGFIFCLAEDDHGPVVTTVLIKGVHNLSHIPQVRRK